jgi:hypothetical protein
MSDIVAKANHVVTAFSAAIGYKGETQGTCASVYPDDMTTLKALVMDAVDQGTKEAKEAKAAAENELAFSRQLVAAQAARIEQLRVDLDRAAGEINRLQSGPGKKYGASPTDLLGKIDFGEVERRLLSDYALDPSILSGNHNHSIGGPPPTIFANKKAGTP